MWPMQQYQPVFGAMQYPSFGQQYQNNDLLQNLFRTQTLDQLLGAFTPAQQGQGQSNSYLDMLMNGMPSLSAPSTSPAASPAAAAAKTDAPSLPAPHDLYGYMVRY